MKKAFEINRNQLFISLSVILAMSSVMGCATTQTRQGQSKYWPEIALSEDSKKLSHATDLMASGKLLDAELELNELRTTDEVAAFEYAEIAALKGEVAQSVDRYIDFIGKHPKSQLTTVALARLSLLSTYAHLDWDRISSLSVNDDYALARLVVLQARALRGAPNHASLSHPTAVPLSRISWMGPFTPYVTGQFNKELIFDKDAFLAREYMIGDRKIKPYRYHYENQTPFYASKSGIYVGETEIVLNRDAKILFIAQSNQYYRVSIDGQDILERFTDDTGKNTTLAARVKLKEGKHIVRIRLGYRVNTSPTVNFWISESKRDNDKNALVLTEAEQIDSSKHDFNKIKSIERIDTGHVLGDDVKSVSDDGFKTWLSAMVAIADRDTKAADILLAPRLTRHPDDIISKYLMAIRYKQDVHLDKSVKSENAMRLYHEIIEAAPELLHARILLIQELLKQGQPKAALSAYLDHQKDFPDNGDTNYLLSQITKELDWGELSNEYIVKASQKTPNSCQLMSYTLDVQDKRYEYVSFDDLNDEVKHCPAVIQHYAKREGNDGSEAGRWDKAIQDLSSEFPNSATFIVKSIMSRIASDPEGATRDMIKHLDAIDRGYFDDISTELALDFVDRLRAMDREELAIQLVDRLVESYPTREAIRNLEWRMKNVRPMEDLRIDGLATIKQYLSEPRQEKGDAILVLDYAAAHIYTNGARLNLTHQITRVLSKEGKNETGEIYLPRDASVLRIRTIKDGTLEIVEPESIDFKSSVTAPNLAVGDFVEVEYLTFDAPISQVSDRVSLDTFFYGSDKTPMVHSEFVYEYPIAWEINVVESGPFKNVKKSCKNVGDYRRCSVYADDVPVLISEPLQATGFDVIPNIQVYHQYGWDAIQDGLYESTMKLSQVTPYVEDFYKTIEMPETDSIWEKSKVIYDAVVKAIDESESSYADENETATSSITRGVGSRIVTLKALYDYAKIPCYYALLKSVLAPVNASKLPSYYHSSYATVLVVDTERGPAYIEPSEDFMPFDYLSTDFRQTEVIPVDSSRPVFTSRAVDLESLSGNLEIEYEIAPDGTAKAVSSETMRGTRGLMMRNFLNMMKNDETKTHMAIENILSNSYGRLTLKSFDYKNLEDVYQPLDTKYSFDIAQFATVSSDRLDIISRIYAYQLVKRFAPLSASERKYPVLVSGDTLSKRKLTFHAPSGFDWNDVSIQDVEIKTRFGKYLRHAVIDGDRLELHESIEVLPQRIPLADYPEFRDFCLSVDEAQRVQIHAIKR